jgi:FkbM family methyltransferase
MKKYYCEIGASDGISQSRSIEFENNENFIGILIEPDAKSFERLLNNRSKKNIFVNVACSSFENGEFISDFFNNSEMSGLPGSYDYSNSDPSRISKVNVKPIQFIFDEFQIEEIEFMFIDVEGKEIDILNGIDFDKIKINTLEVEPHFEDQRKDIVDLLSSKNFLLKKEIERDPKDGAPKLIFERII